MTMIVTMLAMLLVACGSGSVVGDGGPVTTTTADATTTTTSTPPDGGTTTTTTLPATRFVDIYLIEEGQFAQAVTRTIPDTPAVATSAIKALLDGPTPAEEAADLTSAIPPSTLLLGLTIQDGLATIDLSREFESGGGSFAMISRLAQVVYTLTQFSTVDEVTFELDGEPVTVFSNEGLLLEEPVRASDYWSALPLSPTDGAVERWEQTDLPPTNGYQPRLLRNVVLVEADDVLNVRSGPGVDNEILGGLAPGVTVVLMGDSQTVGSSTWVEILTPAGNGWVNSFYLTEWQFPSDVMTEDLEDLLDRMVEIIEADGDLSEVASSRGLYVSHHGDPIRFRLSELETVLTDDTTYKWPSNALNINDPDDAAEIPNRTFAEAIADPFVSVWADDDVQAAIDEPINGGNGRLPEWALPAELAGFHFVSIFDPGDNPDYDGLDWMTWHVSIEYEDGEPRVVGLTIDQWAP